MLHLNQKVIIGSMTAVMTAMVWAVEQPAQNESGDQGSIDRGAVIRGIADHEFAIKQQECDTLKHDANPNALADCMRTADQARGKMLSQLEGNEHEPSSGAPTGSMGASQPKGTGEQGMAYTTQSQGSPSGEQQHQEGASVVEKVKNKVKDTWSEITGEPAKSGGEAKTETAQNTPGNGAILRSAGGVALFCQPITNMQPSASTN